MVAIQSRRGSRWNNHKNKNNNKELQATPTQSTKFQGKEERLAGHIYDATCPRHSDLYIKMTKEIAEWVGKNYSHGADVTTTIQMGNEPDFDKSSNPDSATSLTN